TSASCHSSRSRPALKVARENSQPLSSAVSHSSTSSSGGWPCRVRENSTRYGASKISCVSRRIMRWNGSSHEGDTVDLLQAGVSAQRESDCRFAQKACAVAACRVLQCANGRTLNDHFTQLVRQNHDFGDCGPPLVTGASTIAASTARTELRRR